jgi:septum site-determining protein MinC
MVAAPPANASPTFELKSAALTLVALLLKTTDLALLAADLNARFGDAPQLFDGDPVAIDLSQVRDPSEPIDFAALIALLACHKMRPIAVRAGSAAQTEAALAAGLIEAPTAAAAARPSPSAAAARPNPSASAARPAPAAPAVEPPAAVVRSEVLVEVPGPARPAMVVDKPLRSGQRVYAKGADLVVLAVVSYGAEVIADGHIHVYAPLRGRALAGALGDTSARIFTTCMEPQLVSIAGIYRTTETELPAAVLGKPAQVRLEGEKLVVEALKS